MIFHITSSTAWNTARADGVYRIASLEDDGFVHCSTEAQVLGPANQLFRGREGLVLLCIDPAKVRSRITYEDCTDSGQAYPHIYGPLNLDAVVSVLDFPPNEDGTFSLPPDIPSPFGSSFRQRSYPIIEYDPAPEAIIEPSRVITPIGLPERCVLSFFQDVIMELKEAGKLRQVHSLGSEIGTNPVYEMTVDGKPLTLAHAGVGAPLSAAFLEELIALGCRKFIACGSCGVLDGEIGLGNVVVPASAVRDEGTSYHYLPPAREVDASPEAVAAIKRILERHHVDYVVGKTWTTDGIYRETASKMRMRQSEGCLTVEMEAAAFFAVAQFRGVTFGQLLYGGDDLTGDEWDKRDYLNLSSARQKLFWLAVETCLEL